jgi:hypothetical protein
MMGVKSKQSLRAVAHPTAWKGCRSHRGITILQMEGSALLTWHADHLCKSAMLSRFTSLRSGNAIPYQGTTVAVWHLPTCCCTVALTQRRTCRLVQAYHTSSTGLEVHMLLQRGQTALHQTPCACRLHMAWYLVHQVLMRVLSAWFDSNLSQHQQVALLPCKWKGSQSSPYEAAAVHIFSPPRLLATFLVRLYWRPVLCMLRCHTLAEKSSL